MKQRYTPALQNYEANTAKGLCAYCGIPMIVGDVKSLHIEGKLHRLHDGCWKAIMVSERLKGIRYLSTNYNHPSVSTGYLPFEFKDVRSVPEDMVIREYFKSLLITQAP